jgi:2-methylcitrate dehydratase PrpD
MEQVEIHTGGGGQLATFAAELRFDDIPAPVQRRAEDLLLDWIGSALAGKGARPVESIARFWLAQGPADGPAEVLIHRRGSSPIVAAAINAAASHWAEQDDVHNGSVFHPAAVVFGPALAMAQALRRSGRDLLTAAIAGYEVGIRVGEFLGRTHYKVFHTTGTAGTLAAAAAAGHLLRLTPVQMQHAFGSAGTQSAGLWEFLRDAADSKQLHCAHAAMAGLSAAHLAADGFTGAHRILEGARGLAAGTSSDADPARLVDGLGTRWATAETSFKFHASCRHTHPAADALQRAMHEYKLAATDIERVTAHVQNKAPRLQGQVIETGALARQLAAGHALLRAVVAQRGGQVAARVLARVLEIARVLPLMEQWLVALQPGEPFFQAASLPDAGRGVGLAEAARGALGHWAIVRDGKLAQYQIVAPTSWNFSPRDAQGTPGALEAALVGTPVRSGETTPVAVQHVVRSFDPCMVCTVH